MTSTEIGYTFRCAVQFIFCLYLIHQESRCSPATSMEPLQCSRLIMKYLMAAFLLFSVGAKAVKVFNFRFLLGNKRIDKAFLTTC